MFIQNITHMFSLLSGCLFSVLYLRASNISHKGEMCLTLCIILLPFKISTCYSGYMHKWLHIYIYLKLKSASGLEGNLLFIAPQISFCV